MTATRTYSIGELKELLAAKDVDLSNENAARAALPAAPDPSWDAQWAAVQSAYASARMKAKGFEDVALVDPVALIMGDSYDATPSYRLVLSSLNAAWASNTVAPGSFDDLAGRLLVAASQQHVPLPTPAPIPQPSMQNDTGVDPNSWNAYLTGAAAMVGLVKNPPPGTPGLPGAPPLIPGWLKIGAGLALVGGVALEAKSLLKGARALWPF